MPLVLVWIGQFCRDVIGRQNVNYYSRSKYHSTFLLIILKVWNLLSCKVH